MSKRVLVQAGHLAPREPGFEGGTGTVGEIDLVRHIRNRLVRLLEADDRFEATSAPGDLPNGWRGDAALYLHADGAASSAATGFSFGFQTAAGERLGRLVAEELERLVGHPPHHRDNYTGDQHFYYGFSRTLATAELLIEHGFMTRPEERAWLESHVGALARAEYRALCRYFELKPRGLRRRRFELWLGDSRLARSRAGESFGHFYGRVSAKVSDLVRHGKRPFFRRRKFD